MNLPRKKNHVFVQMWDPAAASGMCSKEVGKSPAAQKCLPLPPVTRPQIPPSERYASGLQLRAFLGARFQCGYFEVTPTQSAQPGLVEWCHGSGMQEEMQSRRGCWGRGQAQDGAHGCGAAGDKALCASQGQGSLETPPA
jgi:hypothetical protein